MSLLSVFSAPPCPGEVTLCERNAKYVSEDFKTADLSRHVRITKDLEYPDISMEKEGVKTARSLSRSGTEEWNPFVSPAEDIGLWKKLFHAMSSRGISGSLQELKKSKEEAPVWLTCVGDGVETMIQWFNNLYGKVFPHLNLSREDMITAFSSLSHWPSSPVRAFNWHPHASKFAVAWQDDLVKVYSLKSGLVPVLKHRHQEGITCLAWRPLSASILAVGCDNGIFVWTVDPTSPVTRLGSSSVQYLSSPSHHPVASIAWSPDGQLLVSASPSDSSLLLWDVTMETSTPLYRAGGGISLLSWSPDESKLLAASPTSMFRIWETRTWTCEKWSNLMGRCKAASWNPDGSVLVFAVADEPALYSLQFNGLPPVDGNLEKATSGAQLAVKCANLTEQCWDTPDGPITAGGLVSTIEWDPTGERLAVIFEDEKKHAQEMVVIFKTRLKPTFEVLPSGFIRGPPGTIPQLIAFQQNFRNGALLTVCWSDGTISFVPLLFTPSAIDNTAAPGNGGHHSNDIQRPQPTYSAG